ncbi:MAG: hypothetical protein V3V29_08280, partial [Acidimicrobiia bacterium]
MPDPDCPPLQAAIACRPGLPAEQSEAIASRSLAGRLDRQPIKYEPHHGLGHLVAPLLGFAVV